MSIFHLNLYALINGIEVAESYKFSGAIELILLISDNVKHRILTFLFFSSLLNLSTLKAKLKNI